MALRLYFKLAWHLRTPFVFLLDKKYNLATPKLLKDIQRELLQEKYITDYFDCDDYAWLFKALANRVKVNGIGFVVGKSIGGWHAWNIVLMADRVYQIEPQTGAIFKKSKDYKPVVVII